MDSPLEGEGHLDEVVISFAGKKHWLWRAVDQDGFVLVATARRSPTDAVGEFPAEFEAPLPDRLVRHRVSCRAQSQPPTLRLDQIRRNRSRDHCPECEALMAGSKN
jgi:DDE domain